MISSVRGTVTVKRPDHVVIEAAGVGYRLACSAQTLRSVPPAGQEALLQAHLLNPAASPVFEVAERVVDTLMGVAIAWVFSYVLPSWERTQIRSLVARTLAAQSKHAQLALALGQPGALDTESELAWRLARREAYDSLSALVQAIQRSRSFWSVNSST